MAQHPEDPAARARVKQVWRRPSALLVSVSETTREPPRHKLAPTRFFKIAVKVSRCALRKRNKYDMTRWRWSLHCRDTRCRVPNQTRSTRRHHRARSCPTQPCIRVCLRLLRSFGKRKTILRLSSTLPRHVPKSCSRNFESFGRLCLVTLMN